MRKIITKERKQGNGWREEGKAKNQERKRKKKGSKENKKRFVMIEEGKISKGNEEKLSKGRKEGVRGVEEGRMDGGEGKLSHGKLMKENYVWQWKQTCSSSPPSLHSDSEEV